MNKSELFIKGTSQNNTELIISFAGNAVVYGGVPQLEFVNSLNKIYPNCDKLFYLDKTSRFYINGIQTISKSIEETTQYISSKIKDYKKVCFIGTSAGGYASILYGSLLNIDYVLAFKPQTNLEIIKNIFDKDNIKYINLKNYINNKTKYKLIGNKNITDNNDIHCIQQCDNIKDFENVNIIYKENINMREIRDSGELKKLIFEFVNLE